jgi:hypothetical protein
VHENSTDGRVAFVILVVLLCTSPGRRAPMYDASVRSPRKAPAQDVQQLCCQAVAKKELIWYGRQRAVLFLSGEI